MNDIASRASNLGKCQQICDTPRDRLKQFAVPRLQRLAGKMPRKYFSEFWALNDITFEINKIKLAEHEALTKEIKTLREEAGQVQALQRGVASAKKGAK